MPDFLIDDVKALLDKEVGDKRILEQILRAVENKEVISNFERNYVKKLVATYLGRKDLEEKTSISPPPNVTLPLEPIVQKPQTILKESEPVTVNSKNNKMMLGIGGAALIIIIIIAIAFSGITEVPSENNVPTLSNQPLSTDSVMLLQTDLPSYNKGDVISINGKSDPSYGPTIELTIINNDGKLVWSENVKVKPDGRYSTLAIGGGDGWISGTFTLKALHGSNEKSITFSFGG